MIQTKMVGMAVVGATVNGVLMAQLWW